MTLVRRPVEIRSFASTIRTALRDRARQYAAREYVLERERQAAALRISEARLRAIIDSTPDCVKVLSAEGTLLEINRAGLPMIEADDAESVVGRCIFDLIAPEHRDAYRAFHERVCKGQGGSIEFEIVGLRGTRRHVETHAVPLFDADAHVTHLAVTLDITARKQAEREREQLLAETQRAKTQADAANHMKDEFLATLSHELRTPLNAILGWARILRTGKVDRVDLEEGLAAIERNSTAQAQIIEDLLDVSRIIAGKFRLEVQSVNIHEVIESAVAAVMPAASARGIRVDRVLDSLAGPVSGDPARLQQVVWNLLSNAVKFTPKGGRVRILLERVNSHVEVSVIDTGMGIKPEFLPHVFDRFRQADSSSTRRHRGLGLGLAIVKQLVEMHGGTVRAKSAGEGQGATFSVTLPISVVHPLQPEKLGTKPDDPAEFDGDGGNLGGVRVLVVDDEPDARRLIERVLAEGGAEVALASSAAEALELLDEFKPHVLVSDIGMPDHDGYDLLRNVRSRGQVGGRRPGRGAHGVRRAPRIGRGPCWRASRPTWPSRSIRPSCWRSWPVSPAGPARDRPGASPEDHIMNAARWPRPGQESADRR